jgi:hypothetical protein
MSHGMDVNLGVFADRARYRPAAIAIEVMTMLAVVGGFAGAPAWLCLTVVWILGVVLTIMTYYRLRDAALSSGWLLLMILQIGPAWHMSENITFNVGSFFVGFIPVLMGCFVPTGAGASSPSLPE